MSQRQCEESGGHFGGDYGAASSVVFAQYGFLGPRGTAECPTGGASSLCIDPAIFGSQQSLP